MDQKFSSFRALILLIVQNMSAETASDLIVQNPDCALVSLIVFSIEFVRYS